jgi:hypothetical protein
MDPIAALGSANTASTTERLEQCRAQTDMNNLLACGGEPPGAHLNHVVVIGHPTPPTMNLVAAGNMFSDRMKHGFYMKELEGLMTMVGDDDVSPGEKSAAMMDVQARIGVSTVVGKIATHLAEGLQSVVVKSG